MTATGDETTLRVALPSKGQLEESTLSFLARCGMRVSKTNPRQYMARMPAFPAVEVLFQRPTDIFAKVRDGDVSIGVTGYDIVAEGRTDGDEIVVLYQDLGYGGCDLVLATPEGWLDVNCTAELADLALSMRESGRRLRVATKYPSLVREFLHRKGITQFSLVEAQGAMEAAPRIGYADMIADITATGTTLRENRLKQLDDGAILHSEACLIGNRADLLGRDDVLLLARQMLERIEAYERGQRYQSVLANIDCAEPAQLMIEIARHPVIAGLRGPAIAPIYDVNGDCSALTISVVVREDQMNEALEKFRQIGSTEVIVSPVTYIFRQTSSAFETLLEALGRLQK
jgi:ATP phosphoribosyltransferase